MSGRRVDANGYVRLFRDGESLYEHRVVWEEHFGAIPDGFHVHHKNHDRSDNRPRTLRSSKGASTTVATQRIGIVRGASMRASASAHGGWIWTLTTSFAAAQRARVTARSVERSAAITMS